MTEKEGVREHARMKWNDIRRIGPLLVVALAAVVMINPSFVGSANNVGGGDFCFPEDVVSAELEGETDEPELVAWRLPCLERPPCEYYNQAAVIVTGPDGECCVDDTPVVGMSFLPCPDPEPEPETDGDGAEGEEEDDGAPAVKLPPPPDPIIGPIWLGAIQVDASIPGLVTLTFPDLLDAFIEDNIVRVYDADNALVFEGHVGADSTILVFSDNAPMLVKTTLTTRAPYYETVGASTTS